MKVKVFEDLNSFEEFEFEVSTIKEILSGLKLHKGKEFTDKIIENNCKYILLPKDDEGKPVALVPDVVLADISEYETLLIIPEINGEVSAAVVAGALYGAGAAAAVTAGTATLTVTLVSYAVAAVINIAISMALNMIMSLLSPTKEFSPSSDPASGQKNNSNLFNGAPLIREQGGSVPLAFGEGFAGGVLISSSLTTVES